MFQERAARSGSASATSLWNEACEQVANGWMGAPLPIESLGNVATYEKGKTNIAFRFRSGSMRKTKSLRRPSPQLRQPSAHGLAANQTSDMGPKLSDVPGYEGPSQEVGFLQSRSRISLQTAAHGTRPCGPGPGGLTEPDIR